ncbi:MAG TPA: aminotransferase DegT [Elusimicrobia bacterium]|nr:aminotransferase DegT [Elusimicrobiota bacterium]HBT61436.1 aminotransferase DegT [Elusimicrobiota bacterium]
MIPVNEPLLSGREAEYVADCLKTGWISSSGRYIERFEKGWAAYCGRRHGVAVGSGTAALQLAVSALELPASAEVLLPAFTIVSCLEAVLRNGLVPVLVDCDPRTYCMDIADLRRKISPRTVAAMPVHIYGHPVDMEPLLALCARRRLRLVEDAAEAHGAECRVRGRWRRCGSFGDLSAFSFYANKNITCGEGGMVLTDDDVLAAKLRCRRNLCFGAVERFCHADRGWNFRMTNMQAAVGCAQLERIVRFLARKRELAARYGKGLAGLPLGLPRVAPWARSSVWMYPVRLKDSVPFDAAELSRRLKLEGVETRPFFRGLDAQPCYRKMGLFRGRALPETAHIQARGLLLPSGQAITDAQISHVIRAVRSALSRGRG